MMTRLLLLVAFFACVSCVWSVDMRGVRPSDAVQFAGSTFACDQSKSIPISQVNDDFCDCLDGSDEPGTAACDDRPKAKFFCVNQGHRSVELLSSRVNDGICDCCDGSDEYHTSHSGQCQDTCASLAESESKDLRDRIAAVEAGLVQRQKGLDEGRAKLDQKRTRKAELVTSRLAQESDLDAARTQKDELESLETAERDRLIAEWQVEREVLRREAESQAAQEHVAQDQAQADGETPTGDETIAGGDAPPQQSGDHVVEVSTDALGNQQEAEPVVQEETAKENFPYPAEYAAPPAVQDSDSVATGSAFPYPAQYAAPPTEDSANEAESDDSGILSRIKQAATDVVETVKDAVGLGDDSENSDEVNLDDDESGKPSHTSPEAEEARNKLADLEKAQREIDDEISAISELLATDFGPDNEYVVLQDQCFDKVSGPYTYSFCAFGKASQKEGSKSTNLGDFDKAETADGGKFQMKFSNGQKCWQGPNRSLTVDFECGARDEILSVDEPAKCTYHMNFATPQACHSQDIQRLKQELDQQFSS